MIGGDTPDLILNKVERLTEEEIKGKLQLSGRSVCKS